MQQSWGVYRPFFFFLSFHYSEYESNNFCSNTVLWYCSYSFFFLFLIFFGFLFGLFLFCFIMAFCLFKLMILMYAFITSTCVFFVCFFFFFDCQVDFEVDNAQCRELINLYGV